MNKGLVIKILEIMNTEWHLWMYTSILLMKYSVSQIDVYTLWNVISQQRNETEIQIVLCSIPQYTANKDVEQSDIPSGLLLMVYK